MAVPTAPEHLIREAEEFARVYEDVGTLGASRHFMIGDRRIREKRAKYEEILERKLIPGSLSPKAIEHSARQHMDVQDGVVLVFSDAHYWPDRISTAHRALVKSCREFGKELKAVICNGDAFDGASISRFPVMQWLDADKRPSVKDELDACRDRLTEIELACHRGVDLAWNLGNHDARYEAKLAASVPEFSKCSGFHLKDHFPRWTPAWSCWINNDVVVKHRYRNGVHAAHNNTVNSGKTIVTGHLHSLKVTPFSDYTGTRFGVDTGTLADPSGPQFDYGEDNPHNHRSGFVVLTFRRGKLLWPELVHVIGDDEVEFRGKVYSV